MADDRLVIDLDGVFADFGGGAGVVHGRPKFKQERWNFFEDWGMTSQEFWEPIRRKGDCFYEHVVQPYPWARELLTICQKFDPNCVFASVAGGGHAEDYSGKHRFVRKYFGDMPLIVLPPDYKQLLADWNRVLIDDSDANVLAWREAGGTAITFPQPWNVSECHVSHRVRYVREMLRAIREQELTDFTQERLLRKPYGRPKV